MACCDFIIDEFIKMRNEEQENPSKMRCRALEKFVVFAMGIGVASGLVALTPAHAH